MAEPFPERVSDSQKGDDDDGLDNQEKPISVLLLTTRWQFDTYGLSTVNKSLVNNLRVVDPEAKKIKITCAVVEEDGKIESYQKEDAEKYKVQLIGAKRPRGVNEKPNIKWLDTYTGAWYLDLVRENSFDFIIGHVPYLANGALNLRDIYSATENKPKVIQMIHDRSTDEDSLLEWLSQTDIVFSVGTEVKAEVLSSIESLPPEQQPIHKLYIPAFPLDFFSVSRPAVEVNKLQRTPNITMMIGDRKDLNVSGLDFPLAIASAFGASKHILFNDGFRSNFELLINNSDDKDQWKKEFEELIQNKEYHDRSFRFHTNAPETLEKLKAYMRKSNLFILPLKPESSLFGAEALSTVAAGVPILVSSQSGMAALLKTIALDGSDVRESSLKSVEETWKDRILEKLLRPEESQRTATRLRDQLLLDSCIAQTHLDFARIVAETSCVRLEVELDTDSVVTQDHNDAAIRFGVHLEHQDSPIDAKKYVLAFIQKLLLQREKLERGLLTDYLQSGIDTMWKEVMSVLENTNRKLVDVQSGCLAFTLFCPTNSSAQELKDDSWIKTFKLKMGQFVEEIGIPAQLRIRPPEDIPLLQQIDLLPRLRELKLRHTAQSKGYETMTQGSLDIGSEIFHGSSKKMEWLEQQPDLTAEQQTGDTSQLNLLETITVSPVSKPSSSAVTSFSVSQSSSSIAITSSLIQPYLSVIYPGTDKSRLILSKSTSYSSVLFTIVSGNEYLVAACHDQIRLWNFEKNTLRVAYTFKKRGRWHMCVIDERTIACVAEQPDSNGSHKIYFLSTDAEKFDHCSTMWVKASQQISKIISTKVKKLIVDICFTKTRDGTSCLLLIFPADGLIQCVEMVGTKVRWQVDKQQMGKSFFPWSICTDGSTVFVTDVLHKLHLLSVEDGSLLTPINLPPFGLSYPGCVRLQGDHLYLGHVNEKDDTYCISKVTKPTVL